MEINRKYVVFTFSMKGKKKPTVEGASNYGLKELPYYGCSGNVAELHGHFNSSFSSPYKLNET